MEERGFFAPLLEQYEQICIFVQKQNDLDTCSCACAIAELINQNYGNKKKVSIIGIHGTSKFLKENTKYKDKPIDWTQKTLVILSEVTSISQIDKWHLNNVRKAEEIVILDHHKGEEENIKKLLEGREINGSVSIIRRETYSSVCEVLLEVLKESGDLNYLKINKRIGEILFMGIYGDTQSLTSKDMSEDTFKNISSLIEVSGINVSEVIQKMKSRPYENLQIFAHCIENNSFTKGNMLYISLDPKIVKKLLPYLFIQGKNGIRQKTMLTYIARWVQEFADFNTIVFTHYSLFDPYSQRSHKRYVYILLNKENPGLERLLFELGFKRNRNRWSKEMDLSLLSEIIERYSVLFQA